MEFFLVLAGMLVLAIVMWKPMIKFHRRNARRALERQAETDLLREMNYARAQQAAAAKILRREGERP